MSSNGVKLVQETFEVSERKSLVRQDRINVEDYNCYIEVGAKRISILNYNTFGIACAYQGEPYKIGQELMNVPFVFEETEICRVHLKCVRIDSSDVQPVIGFEVIGEPINIDAVDAVRVAKKIVRTQEEVFAAADQVPDAFKLLVYGVRHWLESLQTQILGATSGHLLVQQRDFEAALADVIAHYLHQTMPDRLNKLHDTLEGLDSARFKASVEFLRSELKPLIYQSPFAHRVYSKPLGYAGDFEMMNLIYRNQPEGDNLFAKCLHKFNMVDPAARAVRNRAVYLQTQITALLRKSRPGQTIRLLSVACGPAMEIQTMLKEEKFPANLKIEIDLLDQDELALKHAQRQIRSLLKKDSNVQVRFINKAMKNVIGKGFDAADYDMIYTAGLFDYFSDSVAQMAALKMYQAVRPGGQLVIGNFNVTNPTIPLMSLVFDWHLIYRTENEMRNLFAVLGGDLSVEKEDLGINLFCRVIKT